MYYAPGMNSNYFFYDGMYWVYDGNNWYASSWYNGPWSLVDPMNVPVYVLRVPVRYYRAPPPFFHGWRADAPPQWGNHWGASWSSHHAGWDQWNHNSAPRAAPLPTYQRQYSANRCPQQTSQQASLESHNYRYQPKDPVAQQHFQQARAQPQNQANVPARAQQAGRPQPQPQAQQHGVAPQQQAEHRPQQGQPHEQAAARPQPQAAREPAREPQPERRAPDQTNQRNNERNQQNNGQGG